MGSKNSIFHEFSSLLHSHIQRFTNTNTHRIAMHLPETFNQINDPMEIFKLPKHLFLFTLQSGQIVNCNLYTVCSTEKTCPITFDLSPSNRKRTDARNSCDSNEIHRNITWKIISYQFVLDNAIIIKNYGIFCVYKKGGREIKPFAGS